MLTVSIMGTRINDTMIGVACQDDGSGYLWYQKLESSSGVTTSSVRLEEGLSMTVPAWSLEV